MDLNKMFDLGGLNLWIVVSGNGLNLIRVSSFVQMMVLGGIIVFAVTLDTIQRRKKGK